MPLEWGGTGEAVRPTEWRKTPGVTAREWEGESIRRRASSARHLLAYLTPARPIADIFFHTSNFGGRGWGMGRAGRGKRLQEPKGRRGWGRLNRGRNQG